MVGGPPPAGAGGKTGPAIIILAAGIGRRYGGLKQIAPVGPSGEIILDYSVFDALAAGFDRIVLVVSQESEGALRSRMAAHLGNAFQIDYVAQDLMSLPAVIPRSAGRRKPWGTGQAVLICQGRVRTPFAVINADDFYGRGSFVTLATRLRTARDAGGVLDLCLVGFPLEKTLTEHGKVSRGVCVVDRQGYLVEVRERSGVETRSGEVGFVDEAGGWNPIPPGGLASMNMWGFTPGIFLELEANFRKFLQGSEGDPGEREFYLPEAVNAMLARRKATVQVLSTHESWDGLTYPADTHRCRDRILALVEAGVYPRRLWG